MQLRGECNLLNVKIKNARQAKGMTQEELAIRLNVTRQTVSKWEKGSSVPDSETLIKLSEVLNVTVSDLLGTNTNKSMSNDDLAEQLARINEQLAVKHRRDKIITKIVAVIVGFFILIGLLFAINGIIGFIKLNSNPQPAYVNIDGTEKEVDPNKPPIEVLP